MNNGRESLRQPDSKTSRSTMSVCGVLRPLTQHFSGPDVRNGVGRWELRMAIYAEKKSSETSKHEVVRVCNCLKTSKVGID